MAHREVVSQFVLAPGTGKALELKRGMVLRIEQVEGGQCVDFNCFNLHDYREFMHCGRTRTVHGFNPRAGPLCGRRPRASAPCCIFWPTPMGATTCCFPVAAPI